MTKRRLRNSAIVLFILTAHFTEAQHIESYGLFAGVNVPFTIDQGLRKDPRYFGKITLRATPVGFSYGYDRVGHGFVVTPSYIRIGQKFTIKNTQGGEVGERDVNMDYISVPVALKLHLNDLAFFRLSVVAAVNFDYLIKGQELVSHEASKVRYPPSVMIPNEPGYTQVYDGVFIPEVSKQVYVSHDKFRSFMVSGAVGFRSDFDFSDDWSMNFDGRAVFGLFDSRKPGYISDLKAGSNSSPGPDIYGQRRDAYLYATIGISRIIQIKMEHRPKVSSKPTKYGSPVKTKKPRNK